MAKYSDETKAAVMAALLTGQSVSQVAREYDIPKGTVSSWKNRGVATQKSNTPEIGELILEYLQANLTALQAQARQFADPKWLEKQDASSVAVLHGVMTDKAIRLIEAMSKDGEGAEP
jgi:transposase-like protein